MNLFPAKVPDWVGTLAPTVATMLGGPLAGIVVEGLGELLGLKDATKDSIKDALTKVQLNQDQVVKLKELEVRMQETVKQYDIDLESLSVSDRASARRREVDMHDPTTRIIAFVILMGFMFTSLGVLSGWADIRDSALAGTIIGYMSAKAEQVCAYYFGANSRTARTNELLAKSLPTQQGGEMK